jgi:hypothetical protein
MSETDRSGGPTMSRFEAFVAELAGSVRERVSAGLALQENITYLNEMPYCETFSKPLFQTRVTSQALVADRRQERKAETALPPTIHALRVSGSIGLW